MLSLQHEIFLEVARLLSFTKAGQILFLSQSAISKHIKALEAFYKTALFERHGNTISLTQAGELLYQKGLEAIQLKTELHEQLHHLNASFLPTTRLAVGSSTTITLYVLPTVLSSYLRQHANMQIQVLNRNSSNIQKALLDHEIDVGIVESLTQVNTLTYTPFITDQVLAVCSRNSPLRDKTLSVTDIPHVPLAVREQGSGTLAVVEDTLQKNGIRPADLRILIRLGGTEALKNFVLADTCLAFLPKRAILKELAAGELVEVPIENLTIERTFYFIQRKGTENNPLVNAFIRFVRRYYSLLE
ncbi:LysR family transcriptional regulator [Spirosoma sp. RP8]|uniref:LysR family transcriptional regulator n=1 Tax=Spirosoma liriopis TaxID=2937440 RepID=A0ABT0HNI7_9BACT|nr:LysR family transcriptional regulator [Spirosoma liriopis]MCK8493731.1 LysR family transcriptional regulator [Spirosoma liriopis]